MADKPTLAYKALKVHIAPARAVAREAGPQHDNPRPRFSELMNRRPAVMVGPSVPIDADGHARGPVDPVRMDAHSEAKPTGAVPGQTVEAYRARLRAGIDEPCEPQRAPDLPGAAAVVATATPLQFTEPLEPRMVDYVAATVTRFCNDRAVRDGDGWQIRIELRPDILPSTTLHLSLSPHWLLLRFETGDGRARSLVLNHRETLEARLGEALVPRRDVSITCD